MAFNWKSLVQPSQWQWLAAVRAYHWHALPRKTLRRIIGFIVSVLFLGMAVLFIGYSAVQLTTFFKGSEAKVERAYAVSARPVQKFNFDLHYDRFGVYEVDVFQNGEPFPSVYAFYPAWPESIQPQGGDIIRVWPGGHPKVGAPDLTGWGWIIVVAFILIGLVMLEFALLALAIA